MMMDGIDVEQQKRLPNYLLDAAGISIDRMPMLNVIFDRMAASCTDSLQPMAGTPCYFSVNGISNGRVGDIVKDYEGNAVAAVLYAEQWDTRVLIVLDRDFVFTMVEALFGSDGAEPPIDVERSFSNIELRVVQALFERFAKSLQSAFAATSDVTFRLERVETAMASLAIGRSSNMSICANIMLQALFRGGQMFLIIPHSALNPLRQKLAHVVVSDGRASDPNWRGQMESEVQRTEVSLSAVLDECVLSLGEVAQFKVGQVIELNATPRTLARLENNNQVLFWCQIGQLDGYYAMQVADPVDQKREFVDDILSR
ncbi:flagellar motor switch protein FliM [Bradyrhizobium iriomotense]|uniref:Flagellar motor switch protein FliM n=1 Tax=Bradyrhizobium iriomotense TaxID=441950 RepID=A0ABQ6AUR9_9BRAD|nr:FliM/FliN family flagellar motor switch protein [Bradyrhizobium iriomotense]GLR85200.1 flagellar motor switch protein FliM [Bradyrhizobium iriomotense]